MEFKTLYGKDKNLDKWEFVRMRHFIESVILLVVLPIVIVFGVTLLAAFFPL